MATEEEEPIDRPLKSVEQLTLADPRYADSNWTLETWRAEVADITLRGTVPRVVRQMFETVTHLALYAWYMYRFHVAAEVMADIVLERALREHAARKRGVAVEEVRDGLGYLLKQAIDGRCIRSEGFSVARRLARAQLREEQLSALAPTVTGEFGVPVPEIEEASIIHRAGALDYTQRLMTSTRKLRNLHMHGDAQLHGSSLGHVRLVAEAVNQLFEDPGG